MQHSALRFFWNGPYAWKQLFERQGPAGLLDQPRGAREGSRLPERTILMLKEQHPEWGCQRISDMLLRGPALAAGASTVARVLHEAVRLDGSLPFEKLRRIASMGVTAETVPEKEFGDYLRIEPDVTAFDLAEFVRAPELAAAGEQAALNQIPKIKQKVPLLSSVRKKSP